MGQPPYITPKLFAFFRDLKKHNDRDWFAANKARYEQDVREPLLAFIDAFAEPLYGISPHFRAEAKKVGGSLFRIYRDVRFSKDKSPYKTHAGIHLRHERARDVHTPGFYLHLEPANVFMGVGIWHPDTATARRIRGAILEDPEGWVKACGGAFAEQFALDGESLKRPPAGVEADHPLVEDLKRKDFTGLAASSQKEACAADFPETFAATCRAGSSFMQFLTEAVGLEY